MRQTIQALALGAALMFAPAAVHAQAEVEQTQDAVADPENTIIVTGESDREVVEELGKIITRPSRAGKPIARFDDAACVKVSGLPDDMAELVAQRIRDNVSSIRGVSLGEEGCKPNAFVGVLNNVTQAVDNLRTDEPWLFEGLLSYQLDRIYDGSEAVRAWHVFDERNMDGSQIPGKQRGTSGEDSIASTINMIENASRFGRTRVNLTGAVVLVETGALREKTFRQLADYATIRILASVSDEIDTARSSLPTMLTLFGPRSPYQPTELSEFDRAYLESLYDLPANSRDGQVIAAAVTRYRTNLGMED